MLSNKNITNNISNVLSNELDEKSLTEAIKFITKQLESKEFNREIESLKKKLEDDEMKPINILILYYMILGIGRNRTIEVMKKENINRTNVDKVRIATNFNSSLKKKENEKKITNFKINTKTRKKREKHLENINWEEIKNRYLKNGESPINLGVEFGVSSHIISERLKDEGIFDESRSTITKSIIAKNKSNEIDNDFISKLMKENKMSSIEDIWLIAKKTYPWILRRQFHDKVKELGLERTKAEVNLIKSVKSKTMKNTSYAVKVKSINAVNKVFGSVDKMAELYSDGEIGSYKKIADKVNKEYEEDFEISTRQIEKLITGSKMYKKRKSSGQHQLAKFVKKHVSENIIEEYSYNHTGKRLDIYLPDFHVAIEFNGNYWHSDEMNQSIYGISAYEFHKKRVKELEELGIDLIFVWENDWINNYVEIEKALKNKNWRNPILNKYEDF